MNGRLERMDCIELHCEPNYSTVDFFLSRNRIAKWKRRGVNALWFLAANACLWILVEDFGRGL